MTATIIDGKAIAAQLRAEITHTVKEAVAAGHRRPGLAVILVGEDPASTVYVRNKREACEQAGILSAYHHLPVDVKESQLLDLIAALNKDKR